MIYLDYTTYVQDYSPPFGQQHDVLLNRDALFERMAYHSMITAVFGVSSPSNLFKPV